MKNQYKVISMLTVWLILAQISLGEQLSNSTKGGKSGAEGSGKSDSEHNTGHGIKTGMIVTIMLLVFLGLCLLGTLVLMLICLYKCITPCFNPSKNNRESRTGGTPTQISNYQIGRPDSNPVIIPQDSGQRLPLNNGLTQSGAPKPYFPPLPRNFNNKKNPKSDNKNKDKNWVEHEGQKGFGFTEMQNFEHQNLTLEQRMSAIERDLSSQKEYIVREMQVLGIVNGRVPKQILAKMTKPSNDNPFSGQNSELEIMGITLQKEINESQQPTQANRKEMAKGGGGGNLNYPPI